MPAGPEGDTLAGIVRIGTAVDKASGLERGDLARHRGRIEVQRGGESLRTEGTEVLNGAQREITGPLDVEVQRASAAKSLQMADQPQ